MAKRRSDTGEDPAVDAQGRDDLGTQFSGCFSEGLDHLLGPPDKHQLPGGLAVGPVRPFDPIWALTCALEPRCTEVDLAPLSDQGPGDVVVRVLDDAQVVRPAQQLGARRLGC